MSGADLDAVAHAIATAEAGTSAEIRVHLDHRCPGDAVARAIQVFQQLRMHDTAERNGVLVYAAITDHKLAIIGDAGVHGRLGETYWRALVDATTRHFREARPRDGFVHAVGELGEALARHFPRGPNDDNELSDRVSVE